VDMDLVIRGGRVMSPAEDLDDVLDVGISDGKIVALAPNIKGTSKAQIIDAKGCLVLPGLIDFHTHVFYGGPWGIDPDALGPRTCVTTMVDCGTAGAGNFLGFLRHVIQRTSIRIFSFIHIAFTGLDAAIYLPQDLAIVGELEDIRRAIVRATIEIGKRFPNIIRGVKVRASVEAARNNGLQAIALARQAAEALGVPLMVHVGTPPPTIGEILAQLRSGDVLTHAFRGDPNSLLKRDGSPIEEAIEARRRGVLFDIGHGCGSFSFDTAQKLIEEHGFFPDIISSDVHAYSINGPAYDLLTTMSKFLAVGMPLIDIVRAATTTPASVLGLGDVLGSLTPERVADISIVRIEKCSIALEDAYGGMLRSRELFVPVMTIKDGRVLWRTGASCGEGTA